MESQFQLEYNGQAVQRQELNVLGETAALADDRVFAELFRLRPWDGTAARGVLPYAQQESSTNGLVQSTFTNNGSIVVYPFRAFIGTRTDETTDARKYWRDIRTAVSVAEGATSMATTLAIGANASGNPRWDLIYARVELDAGTSVIRKVKDILTKVVSGLSTKPLKGTQLTLNVLAGTPAASPTWPAVPADSGNFYYIPLAYIRVPNGFGASSTVASKDVVLQAPVLGLSRATGASTLRVATTQHDVPVAVQEIWGASAGRPDYFMPPTMSGGESLLVAINLLSGATSHSTGAVIDSRDWRGRLGKYVITVSHVSDRPFAWNATSLAVSTVPGASFTFVDPSDNPVQYAMGMFQTVLGDGSNKSPVALIKGSPETVATADILLYCDHADGGKLKVSYSGTPDAMIFAWIDFTGVYENK